MHWEENIGGNIGEAFKARTILMSKVALSQKMDKESSSKDREGMLG